MVTRHMKRYLTSLIIKKIQIKTLMGYHCTAVRMCIKNNKQTKKPQKITSTVEDMEKLELLYTLGGNAKLYSCYEKQCEYSSKS